MKKSKVILMALLVCALFARAKPVSERQVRLTARAWANGGARFGIRLGSNIERLREYTVTNGVSFYAAKMEKGGTLFLAGDTDDEPVVAIAENDEVDLDSASPLYALLSRDINYRAKVREAAGTAASAPSREALRKWQALARAGEMLESASGGETDPVSSLKVDEVRVDPLVQSLWSQSGNGENYYTPNKYVCGCVATALAQAMRYYEFPKTEVPQFRNNSCRVNGVVTPQTSIGGVYDWANMPLNPAGATDEQKKAIGHLTYDCGVAVGMNWTASASSAQTARYPEVLLNTFGYANAAYTSNEELSSNETLREQVIYSSLDAGYPVLLSIFDKNDSSSGHAIVGDGYGYVDGVSYVHLNMGWGGSGNVWYHLPDITYQATVGGFEYKANTITDCTYDICPDRTGVVVSGRTLDEEGAIVTNSVISFFRASDGVEVCTVTSSVHGVYGALLPPGASYVAKAASGVLSGELDVTSGADNTWGVDITMQNPSVFVYELGSDTVVTNSTLNAALATASALDNPVVEIIAPTQLKRDVTITNNCLIFASEELHGAAEVARLEEDGVPTLKVAPGVSVVISNVLFGAASTTPVIVTEGATVALAGVTAVSETLSVEAADPLGFALAGDIFGGVRVTVQGALTNGAVFGWAHCDLETAQANAAKILHPTDPLLGGEAFYDSDSSRVLLRWAEVDVHPDAAVAAATDSSGLVHYYRSVDQVLSIDATNLVLKKTFALTKEFEVDGKLAISSENGAILKPGSEAKLKVVEGGELVIGNLTVSDFKGSDSFLVVDGGAATLADGTVFQNLETCRDSGTCCGPLLVKSGTLVMESGSLLTGLKATSPANAQESGVYGGAICVYPNATFEMRGGTITGCFAEIYGGGVYAFKNAIVRLSGDAVVKDNSCWGKDGAEIEDDIRLSPNASLVLADVLTGEVGVAYTSQKNEDDVPFATAESEGILEASASSLVNTAVSTDCQAVVRNGALVWETVVEEEGPSPVAELVRNDEGYITNAIARVVYASGVTNYWATFEDAVLSLAGEATIEILNDDVILADVVPAYSANVTTAADYFDQTGYGVANLARADECSITVNEGVSLALYNLDFAGSFTDGETDYGGTVRLFNVKGGTLRMVETDVHDVYGEADRASAAIVVYQGGRLEMEESQVYDCENAYDDSGMNAGVAAGVIVEDEGTVAVLNGSWVTDCYARRAGGVFVGNGAELRVAGDTRIADNSCLDENSKGNMAIAQGASIVLTGVLENRIGLSEGVGGDTVKFGTVADGATAEVIASAVNFCHDVTHVFGEAVDGELRWKDLSTRTVVPVPAAALGPFEYRLGVERTGVDERVGCTVTGNRAENAGDYEAVMELEDGYAWSDGTAGIKRFPWTITRAPVTVTIGDATKKAGEDDPAFELKSVLGLQSSADYTDTFEWSAAREKGETPGEYAVTAGTYCVKRSPDPEDGSDATDNYEITIVPGKLAIEPAEESGEGESGKKLPDEGEDVTFSITAFEMKAGGGCKFTISPARTDYVYAVWQNDDISDDDGWDTVGEPSTPSANGAMTIEIDTASGTFFRIIATPVSK